MGEMNELESESKTQETFQVIMEISNLLNTGLDAESLYYCIQMCENGVHPVAMATVMKEMKREVDALNLSQKEDNSCEKN